jgi:branched-chain amino acid transport system ATP-binding protein
VREVYERLPFIVAEGCSVVIVEQDVVQALNAANEVFCLQEGRIALAGQSSALSHEAISAAYFGA